MASSSSRSSTSGDGRISKKRKEVVRFSAFRTSIEVVFKRWTALKLAVDNGQGGVQGKDIARWMETSVEDYFYLNDGLIGEEVAEFLGTLMDQELNTVVDDNSLEEIGDQLCSYFQMCLDKKEDALLTILKSLDMTEPRQIHCLSRSMVESGSESGSDEMEEEAS